jgi:hypothetical protein
MHFKQGSLTTASGGRHAVIACDSDTNKTVQELFKIHESLVLKLLNILN